MPYDERCPYCFSKIIDPITSLPIWTNDPILQANGVLKKFNPDTNEFDTVTTPFHQGFTVVCNKHIKELQEEYDNYKPVAGWTTVEDVADGVWQPNKQHIKELRDAIEHSLGIVNATSIPTTPPTTLTTATDRLVLLDQYFNYDDDGTERNVGNHQTDWTDVNLTDEVWQGQITHMHLEDLRHAGLPIMEKWSIWGQTNYQILNGTEFKGDLGIESWQLEGKIVPETALTRAKPIYLTHTVTSPTLAWIGGECAYDPVTGHPNGIDGTTDPSPIIVTEEDYVAEVNTAEELVSAGSNFSSAEIKEGKFRFDISPKGALQQVSKEETQAIWSSTVVCEYNGHVYDTHDFTIEAITYYKGWVNIPHSPITITCTPFKPITVRTGLIWSMDCAIDVLNPQVTLASGLHPIPSLANGTSLTLHISLETVLPNASVIYSIFELIACSQNSSNWNLHPKGIDTQYWETINKVTEYDYLESYVSKTYTADLFSLMANTDKCKAGITTIKSFYITLSIGAYSGYTIASESYGEWIDKSEDGIVLFTDGYIKGTLDNIGLKTNSIPPQT
jgi:hypothetical protein